MQGLCQLLARQLLQSMQTLCKPQGQQGLALLRLVDPAGLGAFRWLTYRRGLPEDGFSLSGAQGS